MVRRRCVTCNDEERMFTIWTDGKYYCLHCLYRQSWSDGPDAPVRTCTAKMKDFASSWLAYKQRIETLEEPWAPRQSALIKLSRISRVRPPPICVVEACAACDSLRPFMRREEGDAGCINCLMHGRIIEFEIVFDETAAA